MKTVLCQTAHDTFSLGKTLGRVIAGGIRIALFGDLGSGKTTFVQGLARGMGLDTSCPVTSPTFTIVNEYPIGPLILCHIDLYRLLSPDELEFIGLDDLFGPNRVLAVEWPEILRESGLHMDLEIRFETDANDHRTISVSAYGQAGSNLLSQLSL